MSGETENPQTREIEPEQQEAFEAILAEAVAAVEGEGVPYVAGGSMASNAWGRPSPVADLDLVVNPTDAKRVLKAFESAGFETEETEPHWLFKAAKDGVTVDIIFELEGSLYLDDEMIARATIQEVAGTRLRLMPPEDFIVSQAMSTTKDTPDYWYNALGVLARSNIDWDYLIQRASRGPRRVLALIVYAQSNDLTIPDDVIRRLFTTVYGH